MQVARESSANGQPADIQALERVISELRLALDAGRIANNASWLILQAAGEGIYGLDTDGYTTFANPAAEKMTGWSAEELVGKLQHATIHHSHADGSHYPRELCPIYMALQDGLVHFSENEVFWRKDGSCFPIEYTSTPILQGGVPTGAVVIFNDISERKRREDWERKKTAIIMAIVTHVPLETTMSMMAEAFTSLDSSSAIAIFLRRNGELQVVAQAGPARSLEFALTSTSLSADVDSSWNRTVELGAEVLDSWSSDEQEAPGSRERGTRRLVPILSSSGTVLGIAGFFFLHKSETRHIEKAVWDNSSRVCELTRLAFEDDLLHSELIHQSQHDHLTGLPNRLLLEDRLNQALANAKRRGSCLAVCYIDLDEFKQINDTLGHSAGDALLQHVAQVLKASLRDIDTVARQGGDEFILLLPDLRDEFEASEICERVLARLRQPVFMEQQTLIPAASIGMSLYPSSADTASALLQFADLALYTAKRAGRDRMQRFDSHLGEQIRHRITLERELRFALGREQLTIEYQPLYSADMKLEGFEALLRWFHPTLGRISPDEFVPIAEQAGFIVPIGQWVLREACQQAMEWNRTSSHPIRVFVNVSGVQLTRPEFAADVAEVLAQSGLAASLLELEITETWIIADPELAARKLHELRAVGVRISIDDFGSGQAAFTYLQQLPIDTVKIDRSFVSCLNGTTKQSAIVRAIVALADELGLSTVAEGIETMPQLTELLTTQCGLFQGFLLSKPLISESARLLLPDREGPRGSLLASPLLLEAPAVAVRYTDVTQAMHEPETRAD